MRKFVTFLIASIFLTVSILTGCGKEPNSTPQATSNTEEQQEQKPFKDSYSNSIKETVPDLMHKQSPQKNKFQTQNKDLLQNFINEKTYREVQKDMKLLEEYNTTKDEKRKKEIEQYFLDELKEVGEIGPFSSQKNENQKNKDEDSYWKHHSYWRYFWMLPFP